MSDASDRPIVILGAGLTGLAASVELRRRGVPHRVFEREPRVGGLASTAEEAGYRFDRTGHLLHLRDPAMKAFVLDVLDRAHFVTVERKSVVYSHGVVTRYPFQANVLGLPKEIAYACVRDFVSAHHDPSPREVKTFEDYCVRHFGQAISDAFMIPYNEKLWGVHPREITAAWCDRFVPLPSLDDVLRGAFGVAPPELGYNAQFLVPRLGMGELSTALAERASVVELGIRAEAIDWQKRSVRVGGAWADYASLVSTLPLANLVDLLVDAPNAVVEARRKLRATRLFYLDVALNTRCEQPWHWVYVPEAHLPFYRVGSYSNLSPAMAPVGKGSLYVELSSRQAPDLATLLPEVAAGLVEIGFIRAPEAIRFARARAIDPAYVIYDEARARAVDTIFAFLAASGISAVGRYGAWEYASMEDALKAGTEVGRRLSEAAPRQGHG